MSKKVLMPELVSMLSASSGKSKKQVESFLKSFFNTITQALEDHESVKIKGLGTFKVIRVEARKSVNVSTGQESRIPPHYRVVFTPSPTIAENVNREFSWLEVTEVNGDDDILSGEAEELQQSTNQSSKEEKVKPSVENEPINVFEGREMTVPGFTGYSMESMSFTTQVSVSEPKAKAAPVSEPKPEQVPVSEPKPEAAPVSEPKFEEVPIPETTPVQPKEEVRQAATPPPMPVAAIPVAKEEETEGEKLGEELEKEFGEPEPVEPFGPIEPDEVAPEEETLPQDINTVALPVLPDFDPYGDIHPEEERLPVHQEHYITKNELDNLVSKDDVRIINKNIKKIKQSVEKTDEKSRKRNVKYFIWTLIICLLLITGGFFLVYFLLDHKISKGDKPAVENTVSSPDKYGTEAGEYAPETLGPQGAVKSGDKGEAPTSPSDIIATDKISETRQLTTLAKEYYGNYNLWPYIYIENADKLGHPDRIKPGTEISIPNLEKYGIDPAKIQDIDKAKKLSIEIYKKYSDK